MQKLNKKAMFFEPILLIFFIIILTSGLYNVIINEGLKTDIGKSSSNIIELDREAKLKLDLMEQASLYYIFNSISKLLENQGYSQEQITKENCLVWNEPKNKNCKLNNEKLKENLKIYLQNSFNEYAKSQEFNFYTVDIKEENNKLIFTFNSPNILFKKENIEYTILHKFSKEVNYNFNTFNDLYSKFSNQLLEKCPEEELSTNEELEIEGLSCEKKDKVLEFKYQKEKFYLNDNQKSFEYPLKPEIKFKLSRTIVLP